MLRERLRSVMLPIVLITLSGCATAHRQRDLEIQGLRNQISVLEAQIQSRDEQIHSLNDALNKEGQESQESGVLERQHARKKVVAEIKSRPKPKQIQAALKNAGYNPGPIDGKLGKQTREAIRSFQKANSLQVDGKVGKKTWALLKEYLYTKVK